MRRFLPSFLLVVSALTCVAQERVQDLIYHKEGGVAFTMDEFKPAKPNGIAVLWLISGGWFSDHKNITPLYAKPFTNAGITVFEVVHGSQPRYKIHEIQRQISRAVRYVRANAATFRIDPNRIGIAGGSAGGHLSLMAAGTGDDGDVKSPDLVERVSSRVQSVVALFPPVDFLNFGGPDRVPINQAGLSVFKPAFGVDPADPRETILKYLKEISPIYRVTPAFPPTLLIHGDKDFLVPLEQSQKFDAALSTNNVQRRLIVVHGAGHGGAAFLPYFKDMAEWFLTTLPAKK